MKADDSFERVASLYLAGLSLAEVGQEVGHAKSWVATVLRRQGIPRRTQGGSRPGWRKNGPVTYEGLHMRVDAARGKPKECSVCGTTEDRRYEWANLTGRYEDTQDYARMCVPCHRKYDNARRKNDGT